MAVGVAERNTFLRVAPPNGVANFPVGPKAPEWVQGAVEKASEYAKEQAKLALMPPQQSASPTDIARAQIMEQITQFSLLPGNGLPEVVQSVKPSTDSSAWNMDAVETLRGGFRTERARADYAAVDEAMRYMEWPNSTGTARWINDPVAAPAPAPEPPEGRFRNLDWD